MVDDTIAFIEAAVGGPAHLLGCSAGAVTALLLALRRPELVLRLALVSGVFHRDGWLPDAIDPELEPHPAIAAGYAQLSPDGAGHFPVVVERLKRMNWEEPTVAAAELGAITGRTLVMLGEIDARSIGRLQSRTLPSPALPWRRLQQCQGDETAKPHRRTRREGQAALRPARRRQGAR